MKETPRTEIKELSTYLRGAGEGLSKHDFPFLKPQLQNAVMWLDRLSDHICAQGYIGCRGGEKCTSDHK